MTQFIDLAPDTGVLAAESQRLLGYPQDRVLDGRALELADDAREWYSRHGRPWICAREASGMHVTEFSVVIEHATFTSARLRAMLAEARADSVMLVAVSAGPELEAEAHRRWVEEKPDEYFFLEMYGSAVVEHLITVAGARLCADADARGLAVLPHYSPGYPGWSISEQAPLLAVLQQSLDVALPRELSVLDSGMLRPKKSLLAVFGMTRDTARTRSLAELVPCQRCARPRCDYRRLPYGRSKGRRLVSA